MSIEALNLVLKADVRPSRNKHVLTILANYANELGDTFPSYDRIQRDTCMSRATIAKALKSLEADGYFTKKLIANDNGTRAYNKYRLDLSKLGQSSYVKLTPKVQLSRPKVQSEGGQSSTGRLEPLVTINNPSSKKEPPIGPPDKKSVLSEDWKPSSDDLAWAKERGLRDDQVADETEAFKNHFLFEKRSKKLRWDLTWKNWLRKVHVAKQPKNQAKTTRQILAEVLERQKNEH